ncbi:ubiquitin-fusion degadation (UFD2) family with a UBOX at the C-terminus [Cryptosporidium bovis]|uniref:ubiquitin-fusion degadation (UFD2) family with a UBOX at the C-terminus n=1 Tax=Cryptosporidium bovis TaxID=310047 RepID=UPI00351A6207|nr:ubiquitin-fusion degadation (UFD2) family with a UBOX at the C-terminus [Cryptosporidium bovis]
MSKNCNETEDSIIGRLLSVSLCKNDGSKIYSNNKRVFLCNYANDLELQGRNLEFTFDEIETIIFYRLRLFFIDKNKKSRINSFRFLVDCFNRFNSEGKNPDLQSEIKGRIIDSCGLLPKYTALIIQCPELFEITNHETSAISDLFEIQLPIQFLSSILNEMEINDPEQFKLSFTEYIESMSKILRERTFSDLKVNSLRNIILLSQFKQIAEIIANAPSFFVENNSNSLLKTSSGLLQQQYSLLGCIIGPNPIDKDLKTNENNQAYKKYFSGLLSKTHAQVSQNKALIKQELSIIYDQAILIIKNLLRASTDSRRRVIKWLGDICVSNESKSKLFNSIPDLSIFGNSQNSRQIQSNIRSLIFRVSGQSTNGFSINFLHVILRLLQPVKVDKVSDLDCMFHLIGKIDGSTDIVLEVKNLIGNLLEDATLGENEKIEIAKAQVVNNLENSINSGLEYKEIIKFSTQIFWISCRSIIIFMHPLLLEYEDKLQEVIEQRNILLSGNSIKNDPVLETLSTEAILFECMLFNQQLVFGFWHFLSLFIHYVFRTIFAFDEFGVENNNWNSVLSSKQCRISLALKYFNFPDTQTPQFSSLPSSLIDEVLSVTELLFRIKGNDDIMVGFDFDSYISLSILIISCGKLFKNPHLRCQRGVTGIHYLLQLPQYRQRIEGSDFTSEFILPGLISLFNDVQKSPYFDRFSLRLPIIMLFESLLKVEMHRKCLQTSIKQRDEAFTKFIHLLVSDLNYLLEEGLTMLAEVKKRESNRQSRSENSNNSAQVNESEPQVYNEDITNNSIEEMPIERLESACKGYMQLSHASASLLQYITEYNSVEILDSPLILPQIVTCLNCTLDRLVGPKCLELKVSNFDAFNFNPRQLLANVCMTYVTLGFNSISDDNELSSNSLKTLLLEIINEQRYFKIHTFIKAHYIASREGILGANKLNEFNKLIKNLQELIENENGSKLSNIGEIDIPEEFLDPIMQEIMADPVLLPTSSKIMDRKVIERILISDGLDPFNRFPLSREDLIPQKELREQISEFLKKNSSS